MAINLRSRASTIVGLDIQASTIAAAEVLPSRAEVKQAATSPLPPGLVTDGEFADQEGLATAIKSFFREHELNRRVRLGIANQRVVVRALELPALNKRDELDAAVRFMASEQLPMPLEEAVIDYQVTERFSDTSGAPHMRVVLVAAPKEMIERIVAVIRKAGLKLEGIDLSAFALIRALHGTAGSGNGPAAAQDLETQTSTASAGEQLAPPDQVADDATAYCHLGSVTSLAVAHGPTCLFARTMPYGVDSMAGELAEQKEVAPLDAHKWLSYVGLERPIEELDGEPDMVAETRAVLERGTAKLAGELQASLDYYASQPNARKTARTLVTGPGATINGLVKALGDHIPGPVHVSAPELGENSAAPNALLALAYGLALNEVAT